MQAFLAAIEVLASGNNGEPAAAGLLGQLGYDEGLPEEASHRAAMLRVAAGFTSLFSLPSPDASGLVALGATAEPGVAVSGAGATFREAFEACVGEGAEALSLLAAPDQVYERMTARDALAGRSQAFWTLWEGLRPYLRDPASAESDWAWAANLADGKAVLVPADLCLRRPASTRQIDPPWPLSSGCAAAPDRAAATLLALLELIERDAVALWWGGGRRARLLAADAAAPTEAGGLLRHLRGSATGRRTWLLDITSDLAVPTVVAVSCESDGQGICCGMAARPTQAAAARRAVVEVCQMEVAVRLAQAKQAVGGDEGLSEADRRHLRRFSELHSDRCAAFTPTAPPAESCDIAADQPVAILNAVRARLKAVGLEPCAIDLTRGEIGIPVVRVICPGLQPHPSSPPTPRLRAAIAAAGDPPVPFADVPVL